MIEKKGCDLFGCIDRYSVFILCDSEDVFIEKFKFIFILVGVFKSL